MKNVLVIDDSEELREVVSDILVDAGYAVTLANSPDEAHKLIKEKDFCVILCDLVMPVDSSAESDGMDQDGSAMVGLHAISNFSKTYPQIPVIAISGQLVGEPLQITHKFGAISTLAKPFGRDELLGVIESVVAK